MTGVQPTVLCILPVTKTCACSLAKQSHQEYLSIYDTWVWREKQYAVVQLWPFFVCLFFVLERPIQETNNNICVKKEKKVTPGFGGENSMELLQLWPFFCFCFFVERPIKETNNNICVKKERKKSRLRLGKKTEKNMQLKKLKTIFLLRKRKKSHLGLEKKKKRYAAVHNHGLFWKVGKQNCNKNISVEKKKKGEEGCTDVRSKPYYR